MKKQLVIIGIVALLVCVGLSGCLDNKKTLPDGTVITGEINKIDIISYNVKTEWIALDSSPGAWGSTTHHESGFFHNITGDNVYNIKYITTVRIKNISGEKIGYIAITAIYYDKQGNDIGPAAGLSRAVTSLANSYSTNKTISWFPEYGGLFDHADHVGFYVSTEYTP